MSDTPPQELERLGISYVMGALMRLDAHVIARPGGFGIEVFVPGQALPQFPHDTTIDTTLRLTVKHD